MECEKWEYSMKALPAGLDQRLHIKDLLTFYGVSRTTLYEGVKSGRYPAPDGKDQTRPYWLASTIKAAQPSKGESHE